LSCFGKKTNSLRQAVGHRQPLDKLSLGPLSLSPFLFSLLRAEDAGFLKIEKKKGSWLWFAAVFKFSCQKEACGVVPLVRIHAVECTNGT
jgi:hypothetical protein